MSKKISYSVRTELVEAFLITLQHPPLVLSLSKDQGERQVVNE